MLSIHALFWSYVICGFTTSGVIETHFVPYAILCGFPPVTGATAFSLLMAVNFGGVVLAGWLSDRVHRPMLLGSIYILRGLTFFLLMNITNDPAMLDERRSRNEKLAFAMRTFGLCEERGGVSTRHCSKSSDFIFRRQTLYLPRTQCV